MLSLLRVSAEMGIIDQNSHSVEWDRDLMLNVDCFICGRTNRATKYRSGHQHGTCSGSRASRGPHSAPSRVVRMSGSKVADAIELEAIVELWWAPFADTKTGALSGPVARRTWTRLYLEYFCPAERERGRLSTQTNIVRPNELRCQFCEETIAEDRTAPMVQLLD